MPIVAIGAVLVIFFICVIQYIMMIFTSFNNVYNIIKSDKSTIYKVITSILSCILFVDYFVTIFLLIDDKTPKKSIVNDESNVINEEELV